MYETLKISLLNWKVDGIYLPADCAYIIGNQIIDEQYKKFLFAKKFDLIKDRLFLDITPKALPRHSVIRTCILKRYHGSYYGQQQYLLRLYKNKYNEYGVTTFIEFHNKVREELGRDIVFNLHTLTNTRDLETIRMIISELGL